jgi:hypothetical protein
MKLVIDELVGKEFAELVKYMNRPENSFLHQAEKPSAHSKSRIMSIGSIEQRSVYALENESNTYQYRSHQLYRGIEIEVAEDQITSNELLELLKLTCKFKEHNGGTQ